MNDTPPELKELHHNSAISARKNISMEYMTAAIIAVSGMALVGIALHTTKRPVCLWAIILVGWVTSMTIPMKTCPHCGKSTNAALIEMGAEDSGSTNELESNTTP
jgi:hypothetical protein